MNRRLTIMMAVFVLLLGSITLSFATEPTEAKVQVFSDCKAGGNVYIKKFKDTKENEISFIQSEGACEIEIKSENAGSMLVEKVDLKSDEYKYINFKIKAVNLIDKADLRKKKGDDAVARVYVFYRYEKERAGFLEKLYRNYSKNERDGNAIVYAWGGREKAGDVIENPYSDSFIQIIVEAGGKNLGKYLSFKRNVYEDFKKHFKYEPPDKITSIAVMTDTDNTGSSATGYFKDIFFSAK